VSFWSRVSDGSRAYGTMRNCQDTPRPIVTTSASSSAGRPRPWLRWNNAEPAAATRSVSGSRKYTTVAARPPTRNQRQDGVLTL
jgi:hypothetical protein